MYTTELEKLIHQNGFFNQSIEFSRFVFANFIDKSLKNKYPINNIFVLSGDSGQGKTYFLKNLKRTFEENSGVIYLLNYEHSDIDVQQVQQSHMVFIDNIEYLLNENNVYTTSTLEKIKSIAENNDDTPFVICVRDHNNKIFRNIFTDFTLIDFNLIDFKDVYDILNIYLSDSLTPEQVYNISDLIYPKVYKRIDLIRYIRDIIKDHYENYVVSNEEKSIDYQVLVNKTKKYDFGN